MHHPACHKITPKHTIGILVVVADSRNGSMFRTDPFVRGNESTREHCLDLLPRNLHRVKVEVAI